MNSICLICGAVDSAVDNGDCGGCNECYSIEQGFLYVTMFEAYEDRNDLVVDEDGLLYVENEELDGAIGCVYEGNGRR